MSKDFDKSQRELAIFREFVERSPLDIVRDSIESRGPPEPDILCRFSDGESVGFELKELCYSETARAISDLRQGKTEGPLYLREGNLEELIRKSLRKRYETVHPIELLFYLDGRTARPPDALILDIEASCGAICHEYRRVWFMGQTNETCVCVFSIEDSD